MSGRCKFTPDGSCNLPNVHCSAPDCFIPEPEPEIRDRDGMVLFSVERHHGGVAFIESHYGSASRLWLNPNDARRLGQMLITKANEVPK